MSDETNPDHAVKGLSAGQMLMLFLAGAAVCAVFFSVGFVVGYNEKASKAAPIMEQVADAPDIPPVIKAETPRSTALTGPAAPKVDTPAIEGDKPEPLRPTPLAADPAAASEKPTKAAPDPRRAQVMPAAQPRPTNEAPANSKTSAGGAGQFMVQVAASGTKGEGEKMVKTLRSMNYPAFLVSPEEVHATDKLYRIQVGPFPTRESAEKMKAKLMQDGFKQPFIKH